MSKKRRNDKEDEEEEAQKRQRRRVYTKEDAYRIIKSKILNDGYAKTQIESFDNFMQRKIPMCLSEHPPICVSHDATDSEHVIEILGVRFDRPSIVDDKGRQQYTTPHECHIGRQTYSCAMLIHARYMIRTKSTQKVTHSVVFRDLPFDHIPCMKYSAYCASQDDVESMIEDPSECGGYFISTGSEKVIVGQEGPRHNYPFVTEDSSGVVTCEFRSFNEEKHRSTSTLLVTLSSPHTTETVEERRTTVPKITVRIPFVADPLSFVTVFKLLGVETPEEMLSFICVEDDPRWFRLRVLDALMMDMDAVVTSRVEAAIRLAHARGQNRASSDEEEGIGSKKTKKTTYAAETEAERALRLVSVLLSSEFLPHQGYGAEALPAKTWVFGSECVRKALRLFYKIIPKDCRDNYNNRIVSHASSLMTLLFRKHFTMWRRRVASQVRKDLENGAQFVPVRNYLKASIGQNLATALSTNNFSMQRGTNNMDGVSQLLSRADTHAPLSHVSRTSNPVNKEGRMVEPRLQHPSTIGIIDAWDTPEGAGCGLMRNMAAMAGVRVGYPIGLLKDRVVSTGFVDESTLGQPPCLDKTPVFVSGTIIGTTTRADELLTLLRLLRSTQDIPIDVSLYKTSGDQALSLTGELHINGDTGSFWWPLLRTDKMDDILEILDGITNEDALWPELLARGVVEIMNKDEEATIRVAFDMRELGSEPPGSFTHLVIHPVACCSVYAMRGVFMDFNQSSRNTLQIAMSKAAVGAPLKSQKYRVDTTSHAMWHSQRPVVTTHAEKSLLTNDGVASIQNVVVGILCYGGYNIEDSIILDRHAVDMGMFRMSLCRTVRETVRKGDGDEREFLGVSPKECLSKLHANYDKINPSTGIVEPGTLLKHNDVLVSKYVRMTRRVKMTGDDGQETTVDEESLRDRSILNKIREPTTVQEVITTEVPTETLVRIKTHEKRIPEVGSKYCSRHGQKGTIGAILDREDMPFNPETGMVPHMLLNPHCIPSRMTIGHLLEMLAGKGGALQGEQVDGTPFSMSAFSEENVDDGDAVFNMFGKILSQHGFVESGVETLCDGRTGAIMLYKSFVGTVAIQPQRHMVRDKYTARSRGARNPQNGQPVDGRMREGGLRFGEMERDNNLAHGVQDMLKDRLLHCSDASAMWVCHLCGKLAQPPRRSVGNQLYAASINATRPFCRFCLKHDTVHKMTLPFSYTLALRTFEALHIQAKFKFGKPPTRTVF